MRPQPGESVQDPAAGTGGFLIVADRYVKDRTDQLFKLPEPLRISSESRRFTGWSLSPTCGERP
ncbi:MAG: N-6 DNA methylase [Polyangiaceae bacterium]